MAGTFTDQDIGGCNCAPPLGACAGGCSVPYLYITDAIGGPYTANYTAGPPHAWYTNLLPSANVSPTGTCTGGISSCSVGSNSAPAQYSYAITCVTTGNLHTLVLTRVWTYTTQCPNPTTQYSPYGTGCGAFGGASTGTSSSGNITNVYCGSIAWSGSLATVGSPALPDPVGGSVSFSQ
jgi:hypothetical protein